MIVEAVVNLIVLLVLGILSLFPTMPTVELDFLNGVIRVFSLVDLFVSLKVVGGCLVAVMVAMNARVIWSIIMWVLRKLPIMN